MPTHTRHNGIHAHVFVHVRHTQAIVRRRRWRGIIEKTRQLKSPTQWPELAQHKLVVSGRCGEIWKNVKTNISCISNIHAYLCRYNTLSLPYTLHMGVAFRARHITLWRGRQVVRQQFGLLMKNACICIGAYTRLSVCKHVLTVKRNCFLKYACAARRLLLAGYGIATNA